MTGDNVTSVVSNFPTRRVDMSIFSRIEVNIRFQPGKEVEDEALDKLCEKLDDLYLEEIFRNIVQQKLEEAELDTIFAVEVL